MPAASPPAASQLDAASYGSPCATHFTGGNNPYARLKRALKADIDEDAWASLYSTVSRPFAKPETGKIAVKVINDYGDEVMQVFKVD